MKIHGNLHFTRLLTLLRRDCVLGVHACEDEKLYQNFMMRCAGRTGGRTFWF
jgi:hypothetical protein